jgi:hypothetical protein
MKPFLRDIARSSCVIKTAGCSDTLFESLSSCEERSLKLPIETAIALAGETREESLQIAELLLRDHKPPEFPDEPPEVQQTPPAKFAMRRNIEIPRGWGRNRLAD